MVLFFFFSSRRRHTRSLCDWSSDVCSSDLDGPAAIEVGHRVVLCPSRLRQGREDCEQAERDQSAHLRLPDRKSVGEGKSVDLGGRRIIKKKKSVAYGELSDLTEKWGNIFRK